MANGWDAEALAGVLTALGVTRSSTLLTHSNIGWLGRPSGPDRADAAALRGLRLAVGDGGTLLFPAFSYSFGRGEVFDPRDPTQGMGALSALAHQTGYVRSLDPMFSILGEGPRADDLLGGLRNASCGPASTFSRMNSAGTQLVSICLDAGSTYLHEVEWMAKVSYRYEKNFVGRIANNPTAETHWKTFVRNLEQPGTEASFKRLTQDVRRNGLWRTGKVGRGFVGVLSVVDLTDFVISQLARYETYLTVAGAP